MFLEPVGKCSGIVYVCESIGITRKSVNEKGQLLCANVMRYQVYSSPKFFCHWSKKIVIQAARRSHSTSSHQSFHWRFSKRNGYNGTTWCGESNVTKTPEHVGTSRPRLESISRKPKLVEVCETWRTCIQWILQVTNATQVPVLPQLLALAGSSKLFDVGVNSKLCTVQKSRQRWP